MHYGKLVCLRALEISDLENIMMSYNDWSLRRWAGVPLPKSRKAIKEWLEIASVSQPWKDGSVHLAVTDKKSGTFLGMVRFYDIKSPHMRASMGISLINPDEYSKGYGTDATRVMLWIGFHELGLHSIYLDTMEDNERAIHLAEKIGFKKVGVFRKTEFIEGEFKGLLYMDILREEFMKEYPPGTKVGEPM
ncbi:MAG: GNAT family N-acetyltransferase [Candidatus Thorarchaeota archaeon]